MSSVPYASTIMVVVFSHTGEPVRAPLYKHKQKEKFFPSLSASTEHRLVESPCESREMPPEISPRSDLCDKIMECGVTLSAYFIKDAYELLHFPLMKAEEF